LNRKTFFWTGDWILAEWDMREMIPFSFGRVMTCRLTCHGKWDTGYRNHNQVMTFTYLSQMPRSSCMFSNSSISIPFAGYSSHCKDRFSPPRLCSEHLIPRLIFIASVPALPIPPAIPLWESVGIAQYMCSSLISPF